MPNLAVLWHAHQRSTPPADPVAGGGVPSRTRPTVRHRHVTARITWAASTTVQVIPPPAVASITWGAHASTRRELDARADALDAMILDALLDDDVDLAMIFEEELRIIAGHQR